MNRTINNLLISVALITGLMSCGVLQAAEPTKKPAQAQAKLQKEKPVKKKDPNAPATYQVQNVKANDVLNVCITGAGC